MKKLLVVLCSAVIAMFALAGCGGYTAEDAKDLVEGALQVTFYGEVSDEFADSIVDEKKDLIAEYDSLVEELALMFADLAWNSDPTEEELTEYTKLTEEMLAKEKWEIGEVKEAGNGGFIVPVKIYPLDVLKHYEENYESDYETKTADIDYNLSDEEFDAELNRIIAEMMKGYIENADYLDPVDVEIKVSEQEAEDGETYFMIDKHGFEDIGAAFLSY